MNIHLKHKWSKWGEPKTLLDHLGEENTQRLSKLSGSGMLVMYQTRKCEVCDRIQQRRC